MAQIECGRGHLYDPDKYPACPYCNGNQKIVVTAARRTAPLNPFRTAPVTGENKTAPVPVTGENKTAPLSGRPVTGENRTAPLSRPVTAPAKTAPRPRKPCPRGAMETADLPRPMA